MKKAYTYIITVFIISIILIIVSFILNSNYNSLNIYKNELNKLQSEAYSESAINIVLSQDEIREKIKQLYYKTNAVEDIPFNSDLLKDVSIEKMELEVNKEEFYLYSKIKYKDIFSSSLCRGTIVNSIYKRGIDTLNRKTVNDKELEEVKDAFNDEDYLSKVKEVIYLEDGDYLIEKNGKIIIYKIEGEEKKPYFKTKALDPIYLKQRNGRLFIKDKVNLMGIISVENLFINRDINILGILDIRGDVNYLDEDRRAKVYVKGLTLNLYGSSENNIETNYNYSTISSLSKYIKNFLKVKVNSINKRHIDIK